MKILFCTTNRGKLAEAERILKRYSITLVHRNVKGTEVRSDDCREVSACCASELYRRFRRPLIVEDSGIYVEALGGFPGAYSAWAMEKIGIGGILALMKGKNQRKAHFICAVSYAGNGIGLKADGKQGGAASERRAAKSAVVRTFVGKCDGKIALKATGTLGFGYDPVFVPLGGKKTFAQDARMKENVSHRKKAFEALGKFLEG
jgi:XTP/dITP diphosphohydrolase